MRIQHLVLGSTLALLSLPVFATPADDARAHINAVAKGDVDTVMSAYDSSATFQWIGGPLDGVYSGADAIRGVWGKFAKGNAPLKVELYGIETSGNPKGSTVTADVMFEGAKPIKVRYVLTYRDGKLVNEIWQIDPNLNVGRSGGSY